MPWTFAVCERQHQVRPRHKKLGALSTHGQSDAAVGLADIALYQGRAKEAIRTPAMEADVAHKTAPGSGKEGDARRRG